MSEKKMREYRRLVRKKFGGLFRDGRGGRNTPSYKFYKELKKPPTR